MATVLTPSVGVVTLTPGGGQGPVVGPGGESVTVQSTLTPLDTPTLATPGGGQGPVVGSGGTRTEAQQGPLTSPTLPPGSVADATGGTSPVQGPTAGTGAPVTANITTTSPTANVDATGSPGGHGIGVAHLPSVSGPESLGQVPDGHHAPSGELAHTGANVAVLGGLAAALMAAGVGFAAVGRREQDAAEGS